jgi:hypothetical protein
MFFPCLIPSLKMKDDDIAPELASKQHGMWIAAVLENSWADEACTEMNAFDKETKGGGIILFYIFLHEYVSYSKEAVISTE